MEYQTNHSSSSSTSSTSTSSSPSQEQPTAEGFQMATRVQEFCKKRVQDLFTPMAIETNSINLGQAFPDWGPPRVLKEAIQNHVARASQLDGYTNLPSNGVAEGTTHQYTRAYGHKRLAMTISKFYSPYFKRTIDPLREVLISNGGIACLCNIFFGIVNPGDEVIILDPSFDVYRAQVQMAGGVAVQFPLTRRTASLSTKQSLHSRGINGGSVTHNPEEDSFVVNWKQLEGYFTEKTKAILINSPHNPTGKVFSTEELQSFAEILRRFPRVTVVFDAVYEAHTIDGYRPMEIPRLATLSEDMWQRTITVSSAGKLFSATGTRIGWAIGPEHLIQCAAAFHQYNGFCIYGPLQEAVADMIEEIMANPSYFQEFRGKLLSGRQQLVREIVESPLDVSIAIPQGGCSVLIDISKVEVPEQYQVESLTKDFAFCQWLCKQLGVVALPCTAFYSQENIAEGENLVRVAFCKRPETLAEAGARLKSTKSFQAATVTATTTNCIIDKLNSEKGKTVAKHIEEYKKEKMLKDTSNEDIITFNRCS